MEMGFSSVAELLQRIPGVEVLRPPSKSGLVMVFSTWNNFKEKEKDAEKVLLLWKYIQAHVLSIRLTLRCKILKYKHMCSPDVRITSTCLLFSA